MDRPRAVVGRPDALVGALADRIAQLRSDDPLSPIAVVVGSGLLRRHLDRELARILGAHANVRIVMPGELALELGAESLIAAGRRALPPLAERVLFSRVVAAEEARSGDYFSPVAHTPGLAEGLFRLSRALRAARYGLAHLEEPLRRACWSERKAHDLARLMAEFERGRRGFYGPEDAMLAARSDRFGGLALMVYGILDPSDALLELLFSIARRVPVEIFIPSVNEEADRAHARIRERLRERGAPIDSIPEPAGRERPALEGLKRRIFGEPAGESLSPDGSVALTSAPDPVREVKDVARRCLAWAKEGIPFWDMAVAYGSGDEYLPLIEAIFTEANLPIYLHEGTSLAERPVGRRTLAILDLFDTGFERRTVLDFLTDAALPDATRDRAGRAPVALWDSISREAGVVAGVDQWTVRLDAHAAALRDRAREEGRSWLADRARGADELRAFVADLDRRLAARATEAPWSDHLDYLDELLGFYVEGHEVVINALRDLECLSALGDMVPFGEFLKVVRHAVETMKSDEVLGERRGAFARRGVNVMAAYSMHGLRFRCVSIVGLFERGYPSPPRQDPILLDREREHLNAEPRRPGRLPLRLERAAASIMDFSLAVEAAAEHLVATYPRRAASNSRPRLPSVFFRELAEALTGERLTAELVGSLDRADFERIPGSRIGVERADEALSLVERDRSMLSGDGSRATAIEVIKRISPDFGRALHARSARAHSALAPWDGALSEAALPALDRLMGREPSLSPTALEAYAWCPRKFLYSSILGLRDHPEPEAIVRIGPLERGSLVHRILERFLGETSYGRPAATADRAAARLTEITREEFGHSEERGETGFPAIWAFDSAEIEEDLQAWLARERPEAESTEMVGISCEKPFGLEGEPDVTVGPADRAIRLKGRIDRLDWNRERTRFRVTDYKTGRVGPDHRDGALRGGRALQLPLYMIAAGRILGIDPDRGEARYSFPTRRGGFASCRFTGGDLRERRADLERAIDLTVAGIWGGDFPVYPHDAKKRCAYCDFDSICPRPRDYVSRKAAHEEGADGPSPDPRLARIDELRSIE